MQARFPRVGRQLIRTVVGSAAQTRSGLFLLMIGSRGWPGVAEMSIPPQVGEG